MEASDSKTKDATEILGTISAISMASTSTGKKKKKGQPLAHLSGI